jgi:16S rRNA (adenine1518-N6/adenine1519-N6)-dimethyltransferase
MDAKKSLGQHWLTDEVVLRRIVELMGFVEGDTVVEIGPGKGALTKYLVDSPASVVAVEYDEKLAGELPKKISEHFSKPLVSPKMSYSVSSSRTVSTSENSGSLPKFSRRDEPVGDSREYTFLADKSKDGLEKRSEIFFNHRLSVIHADFLDFDLESLPNGYKIVGNIPYYITGKIVQKCLQARNKPSLVVLLVQKEVAERIAAPVGKLSILGVLSQFYADVALDLVVPAEKFDPPPKVDSQIVILRPRPSVERDKNFEKVVKAGFSAKRKKLKTSLSGGLNIAKPQAEMLLKKSNIDPNTRAQKLSVKDWTVITSHSPSVIASEVKQSSQNSSYQVSPDMIIQ